MDLLRKNDFEIFGLDPQFAIDEAALSSAFLTLQAVVHPDRYASATDAEKRLSLQLTTRINEAYQRLKSPLSRGRYLCELNGGAINAETNTAMPASFLMEQMAWREALDDPKTDTDAIAKAVHGKRDALFSQVKRQLDEQRDYSGAAQTVRQLMFVEKFLESL
jgi:molecular chaperone HscB